MRHMTHAMRWMLLAAAAFALFLAACEDDPDVVTTDAGDENGVAPPEETVAANGVDLSGAEIGETTQVSAPLGELLFPRAFTLVGAPEDEDSLLVVLPISAQVLAGIDQFSRGTVTASGEVVEFDLSTIEERIREEEDLPFSAEEQEQLERYTGERALIADDIEFTPVENGEDDDAETDDAGTGQDGADDAGDSDAGDNGAGDTGAEEDGGG